MKNLLVLVITVCTLTLSVRAADADAAAKPPAAGEDNLIRSFHVNVPEEQLTDLRKRIVATRWPEKETVTDASQGVQLATMQELARYWATDYDWRRCEAKLNAHPQFVTNIDGLDIHFIHVRSKNPNALPLIVTHGWPGSVIEQLKIIDPLTNPTAHGGRAEASFDIVIPSLPGYGFSGKPTTTGWDPARIARAWVVPMKRLGYRRFVAQGGDWGNAVTEQMALLAPPELRVFDGKSEGLTRDDVLDNITLYWLTNTAISSARLYWENKLNFFAPKQVAIPVAVSAFPDELYQAPRSWTERAYPKLIYYNKLDKRRALCGLGATGAFQLRAPSSVPIFASVGPTATTATSL
jgi:pimeloyl-ACP methyl ester carboxylesterase